MTKWTLLPGLELLAFWRGGLVAVYYLVGPPKFDGMVRTWEPEELEERRTQTGLALTVGEA